MSFPSQIIRVYITFSYIVSILVLVDVFPEFWSASDDMAGPRVSILVLVDVFPEFSLNERRIIVHRVSILVLVDVFPELSGEKGGKKMREKFQSLF